MPLVNYSGLVDYSSSSQSDHESSEPYRRPEPKHREAKRKRPYKTMEETPTEQSLPPLPTNFRDLYASGTRVSTQDDPSLHGGRKRTVPHVEGNWPTHVYLEWYPSQTERSTLERLIDAVGESTDGSHDGAKTFKSRQNLHSSVMSDMNTPLPLHISLSCPLLLATEGREDFLEAIKSSLRQAWDTTPRTVTTSSKASAFTLKFKDLHWVANAERTRWFLALQIARPENDELNELLAACNRVAKAKHLPMLYAKPMPQAKIRKVERRGKLGKVGVSQDNGAAVDSTATGCGPEDFTSYFHFSIAWTVEEPPGEGVNMIRKDSKEAKAFEDVSKIRVEFDEVRVKIGNNINTISLASESSESAGILG